MPNPLASPEQILQPPSRSDGISEGLEQDLRAVGALLIQQAGLLLNMPQAVIATASILFQRFWFVTSMKHFGIRDIALSTLFVSSKLEEFGPPPLRIRDLINVFDYLIKRIDWEKGQLALTQLTHRLQHQPTTKPLHFQYEPMDYHADAFYDIKEDVVIGEMQVLKRLGFELTSLNPYGALANYLRILNLDQHPIVPQLAWNFCNDALLTSAVAIYPPTHIAAAAIYLACLPIPWLPQSVSTPIPLPRPWWALFDIPDETELWQVCRLLLQVTRRWRREEEGGGGYVWSWIATLDVPLTKSALKATLAAASE